MDKEDKPESQVVHPQPRRPLNSYQSVESLTAPQKNNNGRRWSIWGKADQERITSLSPTQPPPNTSESNDFDESKNEGSWLGWRKPSMASMTGNGGIIPVRSNSPTNEDLSKEHLLAIENDKQRSSSWSFWSSGNNNNSNANNVSESLSNKILSANNEIMPDAMLFQPHSIHDNESKIITSKNKVVPEFEKSLPNYSFQSNLIDNFNRIKNKFGFPTDENHLYKTSLNKKIKKVLIIGVHGFFPTKVIRPLIGEPTGTSIKFANEAEKAFINFMHKEGLKDVVIQKIALEKDGKIFDRVEFFLKILTKWIDELNSSDFIYIAAHSQGCPVSILLLSKLITSNLLKFDNNKKICILAMAGVNNGPFYGIDQKLFVRAYSTIESNSLMELFDFQKFDSEISIEYLKALKTITSVNSIKIVFVGSINDQLVPLYSSNCLHVRHPNIFRATYIDSQSNTPDFVTRVVSIANQLHNLGFSDHGVIKEISTSLAGPLTGGGHSKIYHDLKVYELGLEFGLKTNELRYSMPLRFKPFNINVLGNNPYHLPWCMRGLLFEVRNRHVGEEIEKLFEEFDGWKPETKQLKDMKYRLNGLKSKL